MSVTKKEMENIMSNANVTRWLSEACIGEQEVFDINDYELTVIEKTATGISVLSIIQITQNEEITDDLSF